MQFSVVAAGAIGGLLWIQSNTVSAEDFARYQNTSDQSLILLQITDKRSELRGLRTIPNPSKYERQTKEELEYELDILRDNLKELRKKKY